MKTHCMAEGTAAVMATLNSFHDVFVLFIRWRKRLLSFFRFAELGHNMTYDTAHLIEKNSSVCRTLAILWFEKVREVDGTVHLHHAWENRLQCKGSSGVLIRFFSFCDKIQPEIPRCQRKSPSVVDGWIDWTHKHVSSSITEWRLGNDSRFSPIFCTLHRWRSVGHRSADAWSQEEPYGDNSWSV